MGTLTQTINAMEKPGNGAVVKHSLSWTKLFAAINHDISWYDRGIPHGKRAWGVGASLCCPWSKKNVCWTDLSHIFRAREILSWKIIRQNQFLKTKVW